MRSVIILTAGLVLGGAIAAGLSFPRWAEWLRPTPQETVSQGHDDRAEHDDTIELSPQARANLGLVVQPIRPETYWRTVQVPGLVVDRPGQGDHGVPAPVAGVVTQVAALPGNTVRPGDVLLNLRLVSETLQTSQTELFKAERELKIVREQRQRLAAAARSGALPESRMIELDNQERRLIATIKALEYSLEIRGLTAEQIKQIAEGDFVAEIAIRVPRLPDPDEQPVASLQPPTPAGEGPVYEVQKMNVHLGQQVQAGQTLCYLHDHHALVIEGQAFPSETDALERALKNGWPVEAEFLGGEDATWPSLEEPLKIQYLGNTVDPDSRTLAFYVSLPNQSREYVRDGKTVHVWRFRPGQRVRLRVRVDPIEDVFVLPADAVIREGPDAYVFRQNGRAFQRRPVHVVHEDNRNVVVAADGSITAGQYIVRNGAAALNRALKAQSADEGGHGHHHHDH